MENAYIKNFGMVYSFKQITFDESLISLYQNNAKLMSSRDYALLRILTGDNYVYSKKGSFTKEALLSSKEVSLLVLDSPLQNIAFARMVDQADQRGEYTQFRDKEQFNKYLNQAEKDIKKEPEKRKVLFLPSAKGFNISRTENFDFARELFKDKAEPYLKFLENSRYEINSIQFYPVSKKVINKFINPILTELWFSELHSIDGFSLDGGESLGYWKTEDFSYPLGPPDEHRFWRGNRVLGVESLRSRENSNGLQHNSILEVAGPSRNFSGVKLNYSKKNLEKYSKILEEVKLGKLPNSKLEKVLGFFEKLK